VTQFAVLATQNQITWASWFHIFGSKNSTAGNPTVVIGNFFVGLQAGNTVLFQALDLPARATIISATADFEARTANVAPISIDLNSPARDLYRSRPYRFPYGMQQQWRQNFWDAPELDLRRADFTLIADSPIVPALINTNWTINAQKDFVAAGVLTPDTAEAIQRQRMGALMTPTITDVLTQGFLTISRVGADQGRSLFIDIHEVITTDDGQFLPDDDKILATSDALPFTSIGVQNPYLFTFSGANQITLTTGVTVAAVLRVEPQPQFADPANHLVLYGNNQFGIATQTLHFGHGTVQDQGVFPGMIDAAFGAVPSIGVNVPWSPGGGVGSIQTTPDLTALVQAQVDADWWETSGRTLILTQGTAGQTAQRQWSTFTGAGIAPRMNIVYDDATVLDGLGGGGVKQPHGAIIAEPGTRRDSDSENAALAAVAIREFYDG
jgi:hypothetical protein